VKLPGERRDEISNPITMNQVTRVFFLIARSQTKARAVAATCCGFAYFIIETCRRNRGR